MSKSTTRSRTATKQASAGKTKATATKPSGPKAKGGKAQATAAMKRAKGDHGEAASNVAGGAPQQRADTKQARLIAMLGREEGASVAEIATAFAWQAHTVRGAIAGALKKKLGLAITSDKIEARGRVYRIAVG